MMFAVASKRFNQIVSIISESPPSAAPRVGKVMNTPFLTKSLKRKSTFLCLTIDSHIIADIDATGVKSEPMFEPIMVANTAG